jgi:hypothetical protein
MSNSHRLATPSLRRLREGDLTPGHCPGLPSGPSVYGMAYVVYGSLPAPHGSIRPGSRSRLANCRLRSERIEMPRTFTSPTVFWRNRRVPLSDMGSPERVPFGLFWVHLARSPKRSKRTGGLFAEPNRVQTMLQQNSCIFPSPSSTWRHLAPPRCGHRVAKSATGIAIPPHRSLQPLRERWRRGLGITNTRWAARPVP